MTRRLLPVTHRLSGTFGVFRRFLGTFGDLRRLNIIAMKTFQQLSYFGKPWLQSHGAAVRHGAAPHGVHGAGRQRAAHAGARRVSRAGLSLALRPRRVRPRHAEVAPRECKGGGGGQCQVSAHRWTHPGRRQGPLQTPYMIARVHSTSSSSAS